MSDGEALTVALERVLALMLVLAIAGTAAGQEKQRRLLVVGQAKGYQHETTSTAMVTLYNLGRGRGGWETYFRSLGHSAEAWDRPEIQTMWLELVRWSMGLVPGDASPRPAPGR